MTNELKPCPWCGRQPTLEIEGDSGWCRITCYECEYSDEPRTRNTTREKAISDWNTRYKRTCHVCEDHAASEAYMGPMLRCSECRAVFLPINGEYRFCPSCGAEVIDDYS